MAIRLFIDFQTLQGSSLNKKLWDLDKIQTHSSFYGYPCKLLPVRMKKIHPKMMALEWSQHFSHYKSMGIFSNAQDTFEILWFSL